ncbi:MAG TPA: hypothetical protein VHZ54_04955 [Solirubrobacterales bacterium]|jgi:hypothetical protein|nr:hypothetical protein [Solirubrobacterales bacterium]
MLKRCLIGTLLVLLAFAAPAASADEPLSKGAEGAFELHGTHGYGLFGLIASTGTTGVLDLFVSKPGANAIYVTHGEVTREHVRFDLWPLGEIDVAVQPTGQKETVRPACGKPVEVEGEEYVGAIDFHGEEGFTAAEADRTPLRLEPILDLVCGGGVGIGTVWGHGLPGAQLQIRHAAGPFLRLDQNHPRARVSYEAKMSEKVGAMRIYRSVKGRLGGGALSFSPSLDAASFSAASPFSGTGSYVGKRPPHEARPGQGTWRGSLKVDFPGHRGVPLAGPGFTASIVHAKRTESHR